MFCWGYGGDGALGIGSLEVIGDGCSGASSAVSVRDCSVHVSEMGDNKNSIWTKKPLVEVVAGDSSMCSLFENGKVKCWGYGNSGRLGTGSTETIGDGPGEMGSNLQAVELGSSFSAEDIDCFGVVCCAVSNAGSVKCWGQGSSYGSAVGWRPGDNNHVGDESGEMGDYLAPIPLMTWCE